ANLKRLIGQFDGLLRHTHRSRRPNRRSGKRGTSSKEISASQVHGARDSWGNEQVGARQCIRTLQPTWGDTPGFHRSRPTSRLNLRRTSRRSSFDFFSSSELPRFSQSFYSASFRANRFLSRALSRVGRWRGAWGPVPPPAHRTGRAVFPHPALGQG